MLPYALDQLLFDLLVGLPLRVLAPRRERHERPRPPRPEQVRAHELRYRRWAKAQRLDVVEGAKLRLRGIVEGADVCVDPGLDGSAPSFVVVDVFTTTEGPVALVTRETAPRGAMGRRARAVLDACPALRSVAIAKGSLRLRFDVFATPEEVTDALRSLRETEPARGIYRG